MAIETNWVTSGPTRVDSDDCVMTDSFLTGRWIETSCSTGNVATMCEQALPLKMPGKGSSINDVTRVGGGTLSLM